MDRKEKTERHVFNNSSYVGMQKNASNWQQHFHDIILKRVLFLKIH